LRFVVVGPAVEDISAVSGAVGLNYEIVHQGTLAPTDSFGYRDQERGFPVDSKTMFSYVP